MYGLGNDTRPWVPIFWSRTKEVCIVHDLGVYGFILSNCVPMVLLGLLFGLQLLCDKRIYWQFGTLRIEGNAWHTFARIATYSRTSVLFLPGQLFPVISYCSNI